MFANVSIRPHPKNLDPTVTSLPRTKPELGDDGTTWCELRNILKVPGLTKLSEFLWKNPGTNSSSLFCNR